MLSLRLIIFAAIGGIALWALFSLLDNLREPELLRSTKAVIVKGCDPIESEAAIQSCPALFCQKALIDTRVAPLGSKFVVTTDKRVDERQLIAGTATIDAASNVVLFACVLENNKVLSVEPVDALRMNELAGDSDDWTVEP
jgi:hypothetical protein